MKKAISFYLAILMFIMAFPLAFAAGTVYESENNDVYATANTLSAGTTIKACLSSYADVDFFKVTPTQNGKLTFTFGHTFEESDCGWDYMYYMKNADGTYSGFYSGSIIRNSGESSNLLPISIVANTTYLIKVSVRQVSGWSASKYYTSADYTLAYNFSATEYYEREFNNGYTTSTPLSSVHEIEGNLHTYSDIDYYSFTPAENGKLSVTFSHSFAESNCGWDIAAMMKNADGTYSTIASWSVLRSFPESCEFPIIGAKANTLYLIKISVHRESGWSDSKFYTSAQYSVGYLFTATECFEREFNNYYDIANSLPSGVDYSGLLMTYTDYDYYSFTAGKTGKIPFTFKHPYSNSDCGWKVELYQKNSDGTISLNSTIVFQLKDAVSYSWEWNLVSGTLYYLVVSTKTVSGWSASKYYPSTGIYTLNCAYTDATSAYAVTYNANGGSGAPSSQTGNGNITLSTGRPSRSGYTFLGWATSSSASSASYQPGSTFSLTADTTLYAVWEKDPTPTVEYTLYYNANGGSGAPSSQTGSGSITLSATEPVRSGYTFLGWSKNSSASSASYQPGSTFSLTADTTLYAIWEKDPTPTVEYTLYYNANGGSGAPSSNKGSGSIMLSSVRPSRSGYSFISWNTKPDGTGISYAPGAVIILNSDIILYAIWEEFNPVKDQPGIQIMDYTPVRTESYNSDVTFSAAIINAPEGATIHWFVNGTDRGTGYVFTVENATSDFNIQARLFDKNNSVIAMSETESVTIKISIVDRLIQFFRVLLNLFITILNKANEIS